MDEEEYFEYMSRTYSDHIVDPMDDPQAEQLRDEHYDRVPGCYRIRPRTPTYG